MLFDRLAIAMSSTGAQQQAVRNGLTHTDAQLQKRHSSGEHVNVSWFDNINT